MLSQLKQMSTEVESLREECGQLQADNRELRVKLTRQGRPPARGAVSNERASKSARLGSDARAETGARRALDAAPSAISVRAPLSGFRASILSTP